MTSIIYVPDIKTDNYKQCGIRNVTRAERRGDYLFIYHVNGVTVIPAEWHLATVYGDY